MCTRALWAIDDQPVLSGRNTDWTEPMDTKLRAMSRGIERNGLTEENPLTWTSRYCSVVATVWDNSVAGGLNEQGLSADVLYLVESVYGDRDAARPGLCASLWVQYYLDNFATVAEALEATDRMNIQVQPFSLLAHGVEVKSPLHLSLADSTGDSAIFEILDGKTVIHHGSQFTVVTNSPPYDDQLVLLRQYKGLGGDKPLPGSSEAEDRFVRAAFYLTKLPAEPQTYEAAVAGVLSVMRNAATPLGANDPVRPNISMTLWTSIADCTNGIYFFASTTSPNVVWFKLSELNLSGTTEAVFDSIDSLDVSGDVSSQLKADKPLRFAVPSVAAIA